MTEPAKENSMQPAHQFTLVPRTLDEACRLAKIMANSNLVPTEFRGKDADILVAVQMGLEVGLPPMQAMQSICVINGKPSLWGDGMLAVVMNHRDYEWHNEKRDPSGQWAECTIKRRNSEPHTVRFTMEQAGRAGLTKKQGPWLQYPERMLQMRARAWAFRDKFADALKGLQCAEEAGDIIDVTPTPRASHPLSNFMPKPQPSTKGVMPPDSPQKIEPPPMGPSRLANFDAAFGTRDGEDVPPPADAEVVDSREYSKGIPVELPKAAPAAAPAPDPEDTVESAIRFHAWRIGMTAVQIEKARQLHRAPSRFLDALQKTKTNAIRAQELNALGYDANGFHRETGEAGGPQMSKYAA